MLATNVACAQTGTADFPDWLEPRGLSVVDLVGAIPDAYLHGTIVSYDPGVGIVVYEAGSRVGDTVVVTTTLYPRLSTPDGTPGNLLTSFGCLGQTPHLDQMGSTVPTSTLRVYDSGGSEVTSEIWHMFLSRMGTLQPYANSTQSLRYPEDAYGPGQAPVPFGPDGLVIPPNSGCRIGIAGVDLYPLTGVFTLSFPPTVQASVPDTQQATLESYIGPGDVGIFQPLMNQLSSLYGWRHSRIPLAIPSGAEYLLLRFPAMPGDAYTDRDSGPPYVNADRLSSGTYRLSRGGLSADLTFSAAFPLEVAWQDADQVPSSQFLPLIRFPTELAPMEYVLPAGIAYDDCFVRGDCPPDLLRQIYDAEMALEIIYLDVNRLASAGQWVPLRMAGPVWSPSKSSLNQLERASEEHQDTMSDPSMRTSSVRSVTTHHLFVPMVSSDPQRDLPGACPCGWFDELGRMIDFASGEGESQ